MRQRADDAAMLRFHLRNADGSDAVFFAHDARRLALALANSTRRVMDSDTFVTWQGCGRSSFPCLHICAVCHRLHIMSDRLVLEVTPEQRRQLKTLAAFSGMTMKSFVLTRTLGEGASTGRRRPASAKSRKPKDGTDLILASGAMTRRLEAAMSEKRSGRKAFNTLEEVRRALGIRR